MSASWAFSIDCVSGFIRIGGDRDAAPEGRTAHPLVRALGPAFETAFGIEHAALFPDEIKRLVEALEAATASRETRPAKRCPDFA